MDIKLQDLPKEIENNRFGLSFYDKGIWRGNQVSEYRHFKREIIGDNVLRVRAGDISISAGIKNKGARREVEAIWEFIQSKRLGSSEKGADMSLQDLVRYVSKLDKRHSEIIGMLSDFDDAKSEIVGLVNRNLQELEEVKRNRRVSSGDSKIEVIKDGLKVAEVDGLQHAKFGDLVRIVASGIPTCLVGGAGTGKTHATRQLALALGIGYQVYRGHRHSVADDLFGFMSPTGQYVPGVLYEPVANGGLLFIDEGDVTTPSFFKGMNSVTDGSPSIQFPHKMVDVHPDFRFVVGMNTIGQGGNALYTGASGALDASSLDRMVYIEWEVDEVLEDAIIDSVTDHEHRMKWVDYVREVRRRAEDAGVPITASPRVAQNGARLLQAGFSFSEVIDLTLRTRLDEFQQEEVLPPVSDFIYTPNEARSGDSDGLITGFTF